MYCVNDTKPYYLACGAGEDSLRRSNKTAEARRTTMAMGLGAVVKALRFIKDHKKEVFKAIRFIKDNHGFSNFKGSSAKQGKVDPNQVDVIFTPHWPINRTRIDTGYEKRWPRQRPTHYDAHCGLVRPYVVVNNRSSTVSMVVNNRSSTASDSTQEKPQEVILNQETAGTEQVLRDSYNDTLMMPEMIGAEHELRDIYNDTPMMPETTGTEHELRDSYNDTPMLPETTRTEHELRDSFNDTPMMPNTYLSKSYTSNDSSSFDGFDWDD